MKGIAAMLLALCALTAPPRARADQASAARSGLLEGERRYANQDYQGAIAVLARVLADPSASPAQKARAHEYLGLSRLILGEPERARVELEALLAIDPGYQLSDPSRSPKLTEFFEEVRARVAPGPDRSPGSIELEPLRPNKARAGRPVELGVVVVRGSEQAPEVFLHWRRRGEGAFQVARLAERGGQHQLRLPLPADRKGFTLEYYFEARDAQGRLARAASPAEPLELGVASGSMARPWYKRWYVWVAVGAVVAAGAAAGGAVAATRERPPQGSLPPGQVTLGLQPW